MIQLNQHTNKLIIDINIFNKFYEQKTNIDYVLNRNYRLNQPCIMLVLNI